MKIAARYCGIDFGTSNSTVALASGNQHALVPLEGGRDSMPSAIFYNFTTGRPAFGREAIADFMAGESGRLMRALKSVIGKPVFHEKTRIQRSQVTLSDMLTLFLRRLKEITERHVGRELDQVVLGRPVQFIEDAPDLDAQAQSDLEAAARKVGFRDIAFQLEPIAAALDYETSIRSEETVLIVDIGGGTSDFSIVRVSPERIAAADRTQDILANKGIRVGGTDFDRLLSMREVMPRFGHGSTIGAKKLAMPPGYYLDLSSWANINALYDHKVSVDLRDLRREASAPELLDRLIRVVEKRVGHRVIGDVEEAKIALSSQQRTVIDFGYIETGFKLRLDERQFLDAIAEHVQRIENCIAQTLREAGVTGERINTVFLTGGSAMARPIQRLARALFPGSAIVTGDVFGAVGKGLGLDARRKFG